MPSADDAERVRMSNMADGPVAMDIPQTMILNMNGKYFIFFLMLIYSMFLFSRKNSLVSYI